MSPIVTPIASPPGFASSRATIARDRSMPWTGTPRRASGSAIRPVPIAELERPASPASSARTSTTGSIACRREHLVVIVVVGRRDELVEVAVGAGESA